MQGSFKTFVFHCHFEAYFSICKLRVIVLIKGVPTEGIITQFGLIVIQNPNRAPLLKRTSNRIFQNAFFSEEAIENILKLGVIYRHLM
jgi:hypothetical protein